MNNKIKIYLSILFIIIYFCGYGIVITKSNSDQQWLKASQRMLIKGDLAISTTNINQVSIFN